MNYDSLAYNSFSDSIGRISKSSLTVILETITSGVFPGSQLYLYYRMNNDFVRSLDPAEFIADSAFIYKYELDQDEKTEELISKHFSAGDHVENVFLIIRRAWELLDNSEKSLHPYI